jgi:hypothetical protein
LPAKRPSGVSSGRAFFVSRRAEPIRPFEVDDAMTDQRDHQMRSTRGAGLWGIMPILVAVGVLAMAAYFVLLKDSDWHPPGLFPTVTKR